MIDFKNSDYVKLKQIDPSSVLKDVQPLLIEQEQIIGAYKAIRDYCIFTNKRLIAVNVQGVTGKKKDFSSLPYSKVVAYSVETAGVFDLDSELELYFSSLGKVKFEFTGSSNIIQIGQTISRYIL
ncbi:PH domain-containing protein [Mediterraneibacter sp. NSJ-55]|uniref:PH domain-containing protein n=1 Tax=Mediterraneibacter hominis TaxID=2763054 RepID=A0A923LH79_9FIRM|nr:PH domain-containing protein [Mediterraneibacter hominis]MBC5688717.1 PH domain-containing protein [Mediterraneibacter hominis]